MTKKTVRIAAVGDIHCTRTSQGAFQNLFGKVSEKADIFVICGDLTDYGLPEEAHILVKEFQGSVKIPIVAVLGNHDFESGKAEELKKIFIDGGIHLLDGEAVEILGLGFAGVKGFVGGFGRHVLGPWGEDSLKMLVHEAIQEALKLESAIARLRTAQRIAIMHYAPILQTVIGEPPEIHAFLGSSRLEEPLSRQPITAVFHGHAHSGSPEGKTMAGVPVYNVAMPLLRLTLPDAQPYRVVEIEVDDTPPDLAVPHVQSAEVQSSTYDI